MTRSRWGRGRWGAIGPVAAALTLLGCSAGTGGGASSSSAPAPVATTSAAQSATTSCAESTLAGLDLTGRVGQLLMPGLPVTDPAGSWADIGGVPVGGVFLYGRSDADPGTVAAQLAAVREKSTVPLQIAVDQEGGYVQTLRGSGFDTVPTALAQGRLDDDQLRTATARWAAQLRQAGITMDLAPVADTVAEGSAAANPPIGANDRQYGSDPDAVAADVSTVVGALQQAGVAATAKHFPGLGRVQLNTDTDVGASDSTTEADDPYLRPFAAAVEAQVGAVMVSSATYPRLDPDRLAVFSPAVLALLREQLGFDGVVISDDVGPAVALSGIPIGQRAVAAVSAGVDLVLDKDPSHARPMATALVDAATADPAFAARVDQSALRVLQLEEHFGLLSC